MAWELRKVIEQEMKGFVSTLPWRNKYSAQINGVDEFYRALIISDMPA